MLGAVTYHKHGNGNAAWMKIRKSWLRPILVVMTRRQKKRK